MALIEAHGLALPNGRLTDVDFSLAEGEMLGVIGPNGSGKSSLLSCLGGLLPHQGDIIFEGRSVAALSPRQRAQAFSLLPQSCDSAWALRVEDVVAFGRLPWGDQDEAAIHQAMAETSVEPLRGRTVDRLSGGERARVWLARVLAGQPRLLLADEPIASLDLYYQRSIMDCLRRYADSGNVVILAIHDFPLAARYCDRLCLLQAGHIQAEGTPAEVLTAELLARVFQVPIHVDLAARPPIVSSY